MEDKSKKNNSLIKEILIRIIIVYLIIMAIAAFLTYLISHKLFENEAVKDMKNSLSERVLMESEIFNLARDNLEIFKNEYLKLYTSEIEVSEEEFWKYYFVDDEGATRMKKEYFDGLFSEDGIYRYGMSSFIGNNQPVDDPDFRRRLVLAYKLLSQLGPAWIDRFANVHASFPENGIIVFWPGEPWGLEAKADLKMNELSVIESTLKEFNPERKPVWTGLYYDETANEWMITYEVPVDYEGKHLLNPSHDVYLTDLMERLIAKEPNGVYNFIIRKDGYLVAHPADPKEEQKWVGMLSLDKIEMPSVVQAYEIISENINDSGSVQIFESKETNTYLAVDEIEEPGWWLVEVYPRKIINDFANMVSLYVILFGAVFLFVVLLIVYLTIHITASKPLKQLRFAVNLVSRGEFKRIADEEVPLPTKTKNEIGLFANSFVSMARNIQETNKNLERLVEERTRELEEANSSLRKLSLLDGLTGIHNRRSFDRDLKNVFNDADKDVGRFSLLMSDIDGFKIFNDTYGHAEGDKILIKIAAVLNDQIRDMDRAYRFGGDEFAIIFNNADLETSKIVTERIIKKINELNIPNVKAKNSIITLSAGIAECSKECKSAESLLKRADENLYKSKSDGGNRVTIR